MDRVNGVNVAELVKKVRQHAGMPTSNTSNTNKPASTDKASIWHYQGDHLSGKPGKPGNVREFETCQG